MNPEAVIPWKAWCLAAVFLGTMYVIQRWWTTRLLEENAALAAHAKNLEIQNYILRAVSHSVPVGPEIPIATVTVVEPG